MPGPYFRVGLPYVLMPVFLLPDTAYFCASFFDLYRQGFIFQDVVHINNGND
jgi:hypothetical protein